MSVLRHFVEQLSDAQCKEIHRNHMEFEAKGVLGDCAFRQITGEFIDKYLPPGEHHQIVIWMNHLITEVWRRYAREKLEQ